MKALHSEHVKFKDVKKIAIKKGRTFWYIDYIDPPVKGAWLTMTYPEACNTARAIFRGRK